MKLCPACRSCYEDTASECPKDHGVLIVGRTGTRLLAGNYQLNQLLGRGDKGTAYAATDLDLNSPVVAVELHDMKVIDDAQEMQRFHRESRTAARAGGQDVGDIYDYGHLPDGGAYLVMELIESDQQQREGANANPISMPVSVPPPATESRAAVPEIFPDSPSKDATAETQTVVKTIEEGSLEEETRTALTALPQLPAESYRRIISGTGSITPEEGTQQKPLPPSPEHSPAPARNVRLNAQPAPPIVVKVPGENSKRNDRRPLLYAGLAAVSLLTILLTWLAFNRDQAPSTNTPVASATSPTSDPRATNSPPTKNPPATGSDLTAITGAGGSSGTTVTNNPPPPVTGNRRRIIGTPRQILRQSFGEWITALNRRDIDWQMSLYMPTLTTFYERRNLPQESVREERARIFAEARVIDVQPVGEPRITFSEGGRVATMRVRMNYVTENGGQNRRGEVVRELRWRKTEEGWKIFSERDL